MEYWQEIHEWFRGAFGLAWFWKNVVWLETSSGGRKSAGLWDVGSRRAGLKRSMRENDSQSMVGRHVVFGSAGFYMWERCERMLFFLSFPLFCLILCGQHKCSGVLCVNTFFFLSIRTSSLLSSSSSSPSSSPSSSSSSSPSSSPPSLSSSSQSPFTVIVVVTIIITTITVIVVVIPMAVLLFLTARPSLQTPLPPHPTLGRWSWPCWSASQWPVRSSCSRLSRCCSYGACVTRKARTSATERNVTAPRFTRAWRSTSPQTATLGPSPLLLASLNSGLFGIHDASRRSTFGGVRLLRRSRSLPILPSCPFDRKQTCSRPPEVWTRSLLGSSPPLVWIILFPSLTSSPRVGACALWERARLWSAVRRAASGRRPRSDVHAWWRQCDVVWTSAVQTDWVHSWSAHRWPNFRNALRLNTNWCHGWPFLAAGNRTKRMFPMELWEEITRQRNYGCGSDIRIQLFHFASPFFQEGQVIWMRSPSFAVD